MTTASPAIDRPAVVPKSPIWIAVLAILTVAATLTLPACFGSVRMNDSYWIDWVWLDQFANELGKGNLYPRWLAQSHHGLGSPVFYYYPPIAFYVGSAFVLMGLPVYASIIATFAAGFVTSGFAMYLWLRDESKLPLMGALIYMAAPYHVFDFYMRGAMAEFLAIAFVPLTMIGIRRTLNKEFGGVPLTAVGYGALIGTHLPIALLSSVFLFAPYAITRGRGSYASMLMVATGLAAGVALAAIYLLPAFVLDAYRDTANLWHEPYLQPQNWTVWHWGIVDKKAFVDVLLISAAVAVPMASIFIRQGSGWALAGLACTLLSIGLLPMIWSAPVLRSVQFPFRLLPVAEFALATAIARLHWRQVPLAISMLPLAMTAFIVSAAPMRGEVTVEQLRIYHPDVPENLPPGVRPYSWPSRWALGVAAGHRASEFATGITVRPVFYYPTWQVRCGWRVVPAFSHDGTQLLSYRGAPNCAMSLMKSGPEKLGAVISVLALIGLVIATLAFSSLRRRTAYKPLLLQG